MVGDRLVGQPLLRRHLDLVVSLSDRLDQQASIRVAGDDRRPAIAAPRAAPHASRRTGRRSSSCRRGTTGTRSPAPAGPSARKRSRAGPRRPSRHPAHGPAPGGRGLQRARVAPWCRLLRRVSDWAGSGPRSGRRIASAGWLIPHNLHQPDRIHNRPQSSTLPRRTSAELHPGRSTGSTPTVPSLTVEHDVPIAAEGIVHHGHADRSDSSDQTDKDPSRWPIRPTPRRIGFVCSISVLCAKVRRRNPAPTVKEP